MTYANGIAHVSFAGGGMFLPVRSLRDRRNLIENVTHAAAHHGRVQILVDHQRWMIEPNAGCRTPYCAGCGVIARPPCHAADGGGAFCVPCALGGGEPPPALDESYKNVARPRLLVRRATFGLA